ncbi:uncharacterized protein N7496_001744 [Penicillium cataractarum]|uniref:FAD-binding domain-containing protein n=1 Tax=Penicillium cataractarum TaxID=2100454 RepID=A0A9W9VWI5_9EURO|nr:uncharacterized protein N7496_001744 [Penicillium cataractarum]KAJ5390676.1 hypothetical protein N7496_001744 [Penicillium cataractarum]
MKIVIIGAGIAGCAAYLELRKHLPPSEADHEIIIYEAYSTDLNVTSKEREQKQEDNTHSSTLLVGGGLGIAANGLNVLRRLDEDLLKDVVRSGYAASTFNMKSKNGWSLVSMDATGLAYSEKQRMHMVAASRHSFWQALRSRVPGEHIINKRISEVIAKSDGKNLIHFVDGSPSVEADLVIGADGVRSTAKRAIFPEAKEDPYPPNYEGLVGVGGFIPAADVKGLVDKGSMNFIFGGNGFFGYFYSESDPSDPNHDSPYHVSEPGDSLAWWSTYEIESCPDRKTLDMDDVTRQLRERHSQWKDPVVEKVIQSLKVESMYPTWTIPPLPTWERDGVVLVGDAAHALPPSSGQGSSQALEDVEAFVLLLSHYLRQNDHKEDVLEMNTQKEVIKRAASQYMALRKPHVTEILKHAQQTQSKKRDMGVIQEYSMYTFLKIMGLFPSLMAGQLQKVINYNIAEEVAKITGSRL